ncbi:MAG: type II toxin-antitoxin system HigB family toxin [Anaerolineae bacterium]|nr:type II toxin-antitoxin system HigB family toxin [Anaerolineae bacterium]MCB0244690.1 type II toxin-antitoxin system HigB family toxin [Anaerolineae bacterium]MCB0251767.1 type II toxin-antitoxin system HigB family toxin [Anaerolineae bacterium]
MGVSQSSSIPVCRRKVKDAEGPNNRLAPYLKPRYNLITSVHFNRSKVVVRYVLTHEPHSRGGWKR